MSINVEELKAESADCYPYVEEGEEKKKLLLEPAEKYRLIVEHASNVILILDFNQLIVTFVSPAFQRILGFRDKRLLGKQCLDLVYHEDRLHTMNALMAGIEIGYGTARYRVQKRDRSIIWVESFGEIIYDEAGNKEILIVARDITDSKLAHEALQQSEERHRMIVDNAHDGISIISVNELEGIYANTAILEATGYSQAEYAGRRELDYIHPEDRDYVLSCMAEGLQKRQATSLQLRYRKKDGNYIWVETTGRLLPKNEDDPKILLISRNISERKKAEEALRRSELRLRQITDNMLDSICTLNDQGIFEYISPSMKSILGFDPDEMFGKDNQHLLHPHDLKRVRKFASAIIDNESTGRIEYRIRHKDGHYIWLESVCRVFRDDYFGVKQLVAGSRDISARKQAETELRKREEALRDKVSYLNTLINNMNELFYTLDRDFRITFGNQKAVEITGYTLEEGVGKSMLEFIPDKDREYVLHNARRRISQGITASYEHYITCRDGREILIKVKSSPIVEDGEITGIMVLAEDITVQRKIEKEMNRLGQLHTVGEMAASIGHEIRNPMTTVQGFLQMMSQNQELSEHQPYFTLMLEELGRANSIITEFLSLAKDKLVDLKYENINRIVKALAPLLVADATKCDKYIDFRLESVSDLLLDEKEIRQLILNLVRNGLEAMPVGGTIVIKTIQEADTVILSVHDEGGGILPEIQEQLGTPFITSKENGTGLGLPVCYSIVDRHRARMDYESGPEGTTFKVRFPVLSGYIL